MKCMITASVIGWRPESIERLRYAWMALGVVPETEAVPYSSGLFLYTHRCELDEVPNIVAFLSRRMYPHLEPGERAYFTFGIDNVELSDD